MKKTSDESVNHNILGLVLTNDRCDLKVRKDYDNSTLYYMLLIRCHPGLSSDIADIRKDLAIELVPYPESGSIGDFISLPWSYGLDLYQKIMKNAYFLTDKYNLWDNWAEVLAVYIISDVLPLPRVNEPIEWHPAFDGSTIPLSSVLSSSLISSEDEDVFMHYCKKRLKFPQINITERLASKNELKKWIDENWDEKIEPELRKIPLKIKKAASIERLALGLWLWELRDLKKMSWDQIENEIKLLEDRDINFFGNENNYLVPDRAKGPDLIYSAKSALAEFHPF